MVRNCILLAILAGSLGACTHTTKLLPHSVYYRYGSGEPAQVWRLEPDGITTVQLTHEEAGVLEYAVSPTDGSLALVINNQLFLQDADGEHRRLVADGNQVDKETPDYAFRGFVGSPVFSPDGQTLAYAFDGLHLYTIATGQDDHVLRNLGNLLDETFIFVKENYSPGPWSPGGDKLLIIMGYYEGSTLAVMESGNPEPYRRLWSDSAVCCTYHWTADGGSVLVANPTFGVHWPGLWRYDAETGEEFDLITTLPDSPHFAGWPVQLPSGDLLFFHGEQFSPEEGIPLVMVRSDPDGANLSQIRPEEFNIGDALWAEDGSLALISQTTCGDRKGLVLVRPDESPIQVLVEGDCIRDLAWGPE